MCKTSRGAEARGVQSTDERSVVIYYLENPHALKALLWFALAGGLRRESARSGEHQPHPVPARRHGPSEIPESLISPRAPRDWPSET